MIAVELPWPPSALRPNASSPGNWRPKQQAAKAYKVDCVIMCRAAGVPRLPDAHSLHLTVRFCPPDRRRRDLDNMLAAIKQGLDAVSEAVGIDDSNFGLTLLRGEPCKPAKVVVMIGEGD